VNRTTIKPRLAVVSPFLDKDHGTERRVVEWISQLAEEFEIHVYSQKVEAINPLNFTWHRVPKLPGPHLTNFLWWFFANRLWRAWDRWFEGLEYDLVFSPGPNCLDADAISVHIVFAQYVRRAASNSARIEGGVSYWPQLLHRKLYYWLAIYLEQLVYTRDNVTLILIAKKTSTALEDFYGRRDPCPVVYVGLDHEVFNRERRVSLRDEARRELGISAGQFALLLVGNDWRNKGLPVLLGAIELLRDLPIILLVVGSDDPTRYLPMVRAKSLEDQVRFLPPRSDVEFYYAAADAYTGPSLEDTFAQPPAEAMACGLPVIVSTTNGTCEIITDGKDGLILADPTDAISLSAIIRRLFEDEEFRSGLGVNASETARQYTWGRNGRELSAIFKEILQRKTRSIAQKRARESKTTEDARRAE
jgi:glycosyltransferase involved in cell wall biosynthesis